MEPQITDEVIDRVAVRVAERLGAAMTRMLNERQQQRDAIAVELREGRITAEQAREAEQRLAEGT